MSKSVIPFVLLLFIGFFSSAGFADPVDELLTISEAYETALLQPLAEAAARETQLHERESRLTDHILDNPQEIELLLKKAHRLNHGIVRRLLSRVQFKLQHENREDLKNAMTALNVASEQIMRGKKKIAYIAGREVNLLDGEWRTTPDGRQYWVSNEYPDIILSPAEYRKYAATAVTVYD